MGSGAAVWLVIVIAVIAANLPFVNERVFIVGPRRLPKKELGWRLVELLIMWALTLAIGVGLESRLGQIQPQQWEFYVAVFFLFTTLAFPGFIWRYLRRGS